MERQQSRYYKNISLFIKLAIVSLAFSFIYKQVFYRPNREELFLAFRALASAPPVLLLTLSIVLVFFNWGIEAWKWKKVVSRSEMLSFGVAVKAVLSGVTIGAFTPNRFGEFAGRIYYLQRTARIDGILMTFVNSCSQLLVTILAGCAAAVLDAVPVLTKSNDAVLFYSIEILLLVFTFLLLWMYFNIPAIASRLVRVRYLKKYSEHINMLGLYSRRELLKLLLASVLRYAVFSLQFYLLLLVFGVELDPLNGFTAIALTFLVITVVPTVALAELGIRGSAALACVGLFSGNHAGIIAASFSLWIINIALPAIAGAFFVFGLKFFREKK